MSKRIIDPIRGVTDAIRGAYASLNAFSIKPCVPASVREMVPSIAVQGIGDAIILTDLANQGVYTWTRSEAYLEVMKFHPSVKLEDGGFRGHTPFMVDVLRMISSFNVGNGHQLQMLRRVWGLPPLLKPVGAMTRRPHQVYKRVILHFEASDSNAIWQRKHWHPKMRMLYPESKVALEKFIKNHPELEFLEVGKRTQHIIGADFIQSSSIYNMIDFVQSGSWFIGIMSGPMHVATAVGIPCIVCVNYPSVEQIVLPCLKQVGIPEMEWMYPQNMHLHQEGASPLVPKFTEYNLEAAFNNDVYPFGRDDWLPMVYEK